MKISDKTLGYASLLTLLLVFGVVSFGMYQAHQANLYEVLADFSELGSIQPQDPVTIDGYQVGEIGNIKWLGNKARITLKFDNPVVLREGTRIVNANYALMGQRRIEVIRSKKGEKIPKSHIFEGEFQPGVTEALKLIENVREQMEVIRDFAVLLIHGDSLTPSVIEIFNNTVVQVDSLATHLEKASRQVEKEVGSLVLQTREASEQIIKATNDADTLLHTIGKSTEEKISQANNALASLSKVSAQVEELILSLESNPAAQELLNSNEKMEKINGLINKTAVLAQAMQKEGLSIYDENGKKVKLFPFKNMNIIGKTAREKAKEREKRALIQENP